MSRPSGPATAEPRPLSALLSQVLVAYAVEFGYVLGRLIGSSWRPADSVSLYGWANCWQHVEAGGMTIRALGERMRDDADAYVSKYERWGFLSFEPGPGGPPVPQAFNRLHGAELRDGFGSTRGLKRDWLVRPTEKGMRVIARGPKASAELDRTWTRRFAAAKDLRKALESVAAQFTVEYPDCAGQVGVVPAGNAWPPRVHSNLAQLNLGALLSKVLTGFAADFRSCDGLGTSVASLPTSTMLRVLDSTGVRLSEVPVRMGLTEDSLELGPRSGEVRLGFVEIAADPNAKRGKVARLTEHGERARDDYPVRTQAVEAAWAERYGTEPVASLRTALETVMADTDALRNALTAPPFSIRSPAWTPEGSGHDAVHARIVAHNDALLRDPSGTLPHYPIWALTHGMGI